MSKWRKTSTAKPLNNTPTIGSPRDDDVIIKGSELKSAYLLTACLSALLLSVDRCPRVTVKRAGYTLRRRFEGENVLHCNCVALIVPVDGRRGTERG